MSLLLVGRDARGDLSPCDFAFEDSWRIVVSSLGGTQLETCYFAAVALARAQQIACAFGCAFLARGRAISISLDGQ